MLNEIKTIQQAINDSLTPDAYAYWVGAFEALRDEMIGIAQRDGVAAAVEAITDLADV